MAKCKNCINLDRQGWCEKVMDSLDPNHETECYYFQQMTNGDRIRAMTDEELAVFLSQTEEYLFTGNLWSIKTWNEWLKKEVE